MILCQGDILNSLFQNYHKVLKLADVEFNKPKKFDVLLGSECFYDFLNSDKFQLVNSNLIFQNSAFEYIDNGSISQTNSDNPIYNGSTCRVEEDFNLHDALRQFWET